MPSDTKTPEFLADTSWTEELPAEMIPGVLGAVERLRANLWTRILDGKTNGAETDRLLTVEEAAKELNCKEAWLYRNADQLPFTRRLGPRQLRFSFLGIQEYIKRQGKGRR